ncbi:MAG: hypothetical protein U0T73_08670 [Chitinophagales bacterium]
MSYLYEFIRSLNAKDKLRLENLPLIGKERDVVDYLLEGKDPVLDIPKACTDLHLSRSHFDKISSLVLNKCYADFVPEGGATLVSKLVARGLVRHALHQVKQIEKGWKEWPPEQEERRFFYEKVFRTICRLPAQTEGKMEMVEQYAKLFLQQFTDQKQKAIADVFARSRKLICEVEREGVTKKTELATVRKAIEKKLTKLKNDGDALKDGFAICQANMANIFYYNLIDPEKSLPFLEESLHWLPSLTTQLDESERINFHLKYGECLFFLSRFEEAFKVFEPFFENEEAHRKIVNAMRSKYIQICMITGRLQEAENELQYVYSLSSEEQVHQFTLMYVLNSIKLYLLWDKYERAFDYLQLMKNRLVKNVLVNYEVEMRNLEAVYFFLMNDYDFAIYIAKKNLKFFASRREMADSPQVGNFSRLLIKMAQQKKKKDSYNFRSDERFEMYQHRELAFYELVLEKMDEAGR